MLILSSCTTCRQNSWACTGHSGHIELPVHVYNVTFFDQLYRLLRSQCVYCHRLQMARAQINAYVCKLRLLQYGLVSEARQIDEMGTAQSPKSKKLSADDSTGEDEDEDDLMARRNSFVKKAIRHAQANGSLKGFMAGGKNPIAAEQRREIIKQFFKDIVAVKKCTSCSGYVRLLKPGSSHLLLPGPMRLTAASTAFHRRIAKIDLQRSSESHC